MAYPEFLIDKRVLRRHIHRGIVDAEKYAKQLAELPDVESNAEPVTLERPESAAEAAEGEAAATEAAEGKAAEGQES